MASVIDICNLALSRLGDSATVASIDPPEGSQQAEYCAQFYPIARDSLLEMHEWKFATRRASLALRDLPAWNWQYVYAVPTQCIKIISVLPEHASIYDKSQNYDAETGPDGNVIIYTNLAQASLRYLVRVTDTGRFSPLFVDALGWLLASHLAGPIYKGTEGARMAQAAYSGFRAVLSQAVVSDANQQQMELKHTPDWIAARGGSCIAGDIPGMPSGWRP